MIEGRISSPTLVEAVQHRPDGYIEDLIDEVTGIRTDGAVYLPLTRWHSLSVKYEDYHTEQRPAEIDIFRRQNNALFSITLEELP